MLCLPAFSTPCTSPLPCGTQPGDVLELERAGIPHGSQGVVSWGSHFFQVSIVLPDAGQFPEGGPELQALATLQSLLLVPPPVT